MAIKDSNLSMIFFRDKCKENNLRNTPQRTVIYKELSKSKEHPSADMIFKKARRIFPDISFDTVNRTVLTFARIGVINVVEGYGDSKRFDPDIDDHHHFRCIRCNNIIDFHDKSYDNLKVPEEIENQFTGIRKKVCIEGICKKCKLK
jgi:Fur family peroxide stress response transcriptional regulator